MPRQGQCQIAAFRNRRWFRIQRKCPGPALARLKTSIGLSCTRFKANRRHQRGIARGGNARHALLPIVQQSGFVAEAVEQQFSLGLGRDANLLANRKKHAELQVHHFIRFLRLYGKRKQNLIVITNCFTPGIVKAAGDGIAHLDCARCFLNRSNQTAGEFPYRPACANRFSSPAPVQRECRPAKYPRPARLRSWKPYRVCGTLAPRASCQKRRGRQKQDRACLLFMSFIMALEP